MSNTHRENRDELINFVKSDLVGPMKNYKGLEFTPIDTNQKIIFNDRKDVNKLFCDMDTGEEILHMWDNSFNPLKTYSAGILYPVGATIGLDNEKDEIDEELEGEIEVLEPNISKKDSEKLAKKVKNLDDDQQIDVSAVNERKPSAIALSFRFSVNKDTTFKAKFSGAAYEPKMTYEENSLKKFKTFFIRRPFEKEIVIQPKRILEIGKDSKGGVADRMYLPEKEPDEFISQHYGINLKYSFFIRRFYEESLVDIPTNKEPEYIATIVFENTSPHQKKKAKYHFFKQKSKLMLQMDKTLQ